MNKELKNILFITPGFAKNEEDSTCIPALQDFVLGLNQYYPLLKITIITLHYPEKSRYYEWNGNKVYSIGANNCRFPKRFLYWNKLKSQIRELHKKESFNLIHTFWFDEVSYVVSKMKLDIPVYCTFMGQDALGKNSYAKRIKLQENRLIALSQIHQNNIKKYLRLKVTEVIPWGVSPLDFEEGTKAIDLINIGSFNEIKNQKEAIQIMAQVVSIYPNLKCVFVGDGPFRAEIEKEIISLNLGQNISFTGQLDRKDVLDLLGQSKILLHSSKYESFGMIFTEAVTCQTMIVSKEVGIAKKSNFWAIYSNPNDAVNQINEMLNQPNYPIKSDVAKLDIKNTIDQYVNFWK